jgi:hypothetical protein
LRGGPGVLRPVSPAGERDPRPGRLGLGRSLRLTAPSSRHLTVSTVGRVASPLGAGRRPGSYLVGATAIWMNRPHSRVASSRRSDRWAGGAPNPYDEGIPLGSDAWRCILYSSPALSAGRRLLVPATEG